MTDASSPKRRKLSPDIDISTPNDDGNLESLLESWLGKGGSTTGPPPHLESLLGKGVKIRQDLFKLQKLLDAAGFRTSIVQSPRLAVSLYKDSCVSSETLDPKQEYLLTMLGIHPQQEKREAFYQQHFRKGFCAHQFLARLQVACRKAMKEPRVSEWVDQNVNKNSSLDTQQLVQLLLKSDPKLRQEQLDHEMERIGWHNSTLSNALVQQFLRSHHDCIVKDVFFKTSHVAKFERSTFYLYDSSIDLVKPASNFIFLPDLARALQQPAHDKDIERGTKAIVQSMMTTFWSHLLRHGGYYASDTMKQQLSPALERYFLSGLRQDPKVPLKLTAHFEPCEPLCLHLWGKAGSGKSSFVRHVPPAIQAAVEAHADPELLVRFVKQALNKPYNDLRLELDLRPNNNDLSVMSIIASRKCTMTQSKPGLVVISLEEMAQYFDHDTAMHHDPHQLQVCQLISQRFGGRKGEFDATKKAPRNSEKRGIGNDASLITLFTSNYTLEQPSREALARLPMFRHLTVAHMTAITGKDRSDFAHAYFQQSISDRIKGSALSGGIHLKSLDIPLGDEDTRPLVRHLRMLAYYVSSVILADSKPKESSNKIEISVTQQGKSCEVVVGDQPALHLQVGTLDNLFPVQPQVFDPRTKQVMEYLKKCETTLPEASWNELSTILDFWLGGALAPAVILSQNQSLVETLVGAIETTLKESGVQSLSNIEAGSYKMMKSLYDPNDTPNLRDDILKLGGGRRTVGGVGSNTLVATHLKCPTTDAQLCLREMLEDTPSMTAFSSDRSALYKTGLLFAVHIEEGDDMTPELKSRASLIL